ncbi:MAG: hypothetical protein K2N87_20500 [Eubacterium sp.]|nr:hypothetical protein [Eubacterium sp.]
MKKADVPEALQKNFNDIKRVQVLHEVPGSLDFQGVSETKAKESGIKSSKNTIKYIILYVNNCCNTAHSRV